MLITYVRQFTGLPFRYGAYVRDTATGKVVATCSHVHQTREGAKRGDVYAQRCADRMLARMVRRAASR